jgi:hypothetical protein
MNQCKRDLSLSLRQSYQGWNRLENRKPARSGRLKNATGPVRPVN